MPTYIYRSAKTGRIVTEKWAKKHPATTVREKTTIRDTIKTINKKAHSVGK